MTNKKNANAQALYAYFGGKKIENPSWLQYLYKNLNAADYVGYEFDEEAIKAFKKRNVDSFR